jgi:2',3'-cyclic-nucleotide 2'-phosphodiesterase (5'-nucleotidase family)
MLRGAPVVYDKGENIRELLVREIQERGTIDSGSYAAHDWRIVPEGSALAVRRLFGVAEQPVPVSAGDTILLRIMATGDLHGALVSRVRAPDQKPSGGVAEIASLMDSLATGCGCATLRLDAGDALQGTVTANVTHGRAMADALEHMRIAAAAIGERDLEWSVDTLRVRMSEARFPWLAANVFDAASGARPEWVVPSWMFQVGGYRVAVVGYITSDTKASLKPELTATLRFADGALPLHDVLARIRDQKPDLTIVLAHAGMNCEGSACTGEIVRLVEGLEPRSVDLMIVGHNGNGASTRIAGVPIVQDREGGSSLIVADLVKTAAGGKEIRTRLEPVDSGRVTPDAGVADLVATYRRKVESLINRPVATCKFPLVRDGDDSRLGLLIAEARRNVLRADVGLVRHDDIRADLAPGPVSYGQLFEIQSAQNGLVKLTLSGRELQELLEHTLDQQGRPTVHVAGAIVRYDPGRAPLKRIRSIELATGKKFRTGDRYTVATDDFVSSGGAGLGSIAASSAEPGGMLDVDALTLYLRRLPQPFVPPEGQGFTASR